MAARVSRFVAEGERGRRMGLVRTAGKRVGIAGELLFFFMLRRWWMLPVILAVLLMALLIILAQSSALAPFLYPLF
jgi:hypothetical protein